MFKHIARLLITITLVSAPALAQGPGELSPELVAELQDLMDAETATSIPPGMVLWIDAPELQFAGASGFADVAAGVPMPPEGAFRVGSITKTFTAVIMLQLAEEGALSLDDALADWLPDVAAALPHGDQITLHHLLSHTSGLYNLTANMDYVSDTLGRAEVDAATQTAVGACADADPYTILERYIYGQRPQFEPGAMWAYNNTGFMLLGMVIEAAAGEPLADLYRARILEPLGMADTFLDCYEPATIEIVHGYSDIISGDVIDVTAVHEAAAWSGGGLVSTAPDLIKFIRGLFSGQLFSDPASLQAMTTGTEANISYGLGLMLIGAARYGHDGRMAGFRSLLHYSAEYDTALVVLYNFETKAPDPIAAAAWEIVRPVLEDE